MTYHLSFDDCDESIICTPEHPFYILNTGSNTPIVNFEGRDESKYARQWVQAKYLKVGDKVLLSDGKTAILTKTELEHLSEPITTYNFEVADFHTYYVGEQGILVHNDCPYAYLDEALQRQGLDKVPEGGFKETWVKNGTTYEVRAHAGNPAHTGAKQVFRVSRHNYGSGLEYLGMDGSWYHTIYLKPRSHLYNPLLGALTHIPVP